MPETMLELNQVIPGGAQSGDEPLPLTYELRRRARFRATTESGRDVGIFLERGGVLRSGDALVAPTGERIAVAAAPEALTVAQADDWPAFARACYHLGNRHVTLQIGERWLRMQPDHVLEAMLEGLGLRLESAVLPFEPEEGAYRHSHSHSDRPLAPRQSAPLAIRRLTASP